MTTESNTATDTVPVVNSKTAPAVPASVALFLEKARGKEVTLYSLHERSYHADKVGVLDDVKYADGVLEVAIRDKDGAATSVMYPLLDAPDFGNNDFSTALCLRLADGIHYALIHLSKK